MNPFPELANLTLDDLIERFCGDPPDPEYAAEYFMEIGCRIIRHGERGVTFLLDERTRVEREESRLRGVLCGLSCERIRYPNVRPVFYAHLSDPRDIIKVDAIAGLGLYGDKRALSSVIALCGHPSGMVRGAVLRYLQDCYPKDAVPAALAALNDPHPVVREGAIDVLDELLVTGRYLDRIRPFLEDPDKDVRAAANWAIEAAEYCPAEVDTE
jgi:hypothetical protein